MHLACYHGYLGIIKMMIASKRSPGMDIDEYNQRLQDGQGISLVGTQFDSGFFKKLMLGRTKVRFIYPIPFSLVVTLQEKSLCISNRYLPSPSNPHMHSLRNSWCPCVYVLPFCMLTLTSANLGEVDSIDDSSERRTLGACEIPSAVQCGQEQCSHGKQGA